MTSWTARVGEILDSTADALICSANTQLNLSGGVGGAFNIRYRGAMQEYLRKWLVDRQRRFVMPGNVVVAPPCGSPFRAVIHAIAVDAFYDTSTDVIRDTYANAFAAAAESGCKTIAASCLACGYGRASPQLFVEAISVFVKHDLFGIANVAFVSSNEELVDAIRSEIAGQTSR